MSAARPVPRAPGRIPRFPSIRNPSSLRSSPAPQVNKSKSIRSCKNPDCDTSDVREQDGQLLCFNCGAVVSDSVIVNDVTFGEAPSGAALVQGTTVHEGQRYAKPSGTSFRRGGRTAEDAQDSANRAAKEEMIRLANTLYISHVVEKAYLLYKLGRMHSFHRPVTESVAICLYIACREQEENTILLIDIAEKIKRNVFDLGAVYKSFIRDISYPQAHQHTIPLVQIEPLLFKYAKRLEFGDATKTVASDAALILARMKRDWMVDGRQPQALCGAALILAARMNNFRRSIREVVYVVKAGDATVHRRMEEFRRTKAGRLSVTQFRQYSDRLKDTAEPPSIYMAREKLIRDQERIRETSTIVISSDEESDDDSSLDEALQPRVDDDGFAIPDLPRQRRGTKQSSSNLIKHKRGGDDDAETSSSASQRRNGGSQKSSADKETPESNRSRELSGHYQTSSSNLKSRKPVREGDVESTSSSKKSKRGQSREISVNEEIPEPSSSDQRKRKRAQGDETAASSSANKSKRGRSRKPPLEEETPEPGSSREESEEPNATLVKRGRRRERREIPVAIVLTEEDLIAENALESEISTIVQDSINMDTEEVFQVTAARAKAIAEAEREREGRQDIADDAIIGEEEFDDDPEVANCLLSASEIEVKEKIWVTHNHDWLRRQQEMLLNKQMEDAMGKKKRKGNKRGAKSASEHATPASTPAEAAQRLLAKKNSKPAFSRHINYERLKQIYNVGDEDEESSTKDDEEEEKVVEDAVAGAEEEEEDEEEEEEEEDEEIYEDDDIVYASEEEVADEDDVDYDRMGLEGTGYID